MPLTPEQAKLFKDANFLSVATQGADGCPRVTIIWTDLDEDGRIVLDGTETRKWVKNILRTKKVAVAVHDEKNPYRKVSVVGRIVDTKSEEEGARDWINRLHRKYHGAGAGDYPVREGERRFLFKVEPESVHSMGV